MFSIIINIVSKASFPSENFEQPDQFPLEPYRPRGWILAGEALLVTEVLGNME